MTIQTADPGSLLIVDDEEMNRDMLSQRLELKGYKVTAADDGPRALSLIEDHAFDVILLDVMMPRLNGLEVLRILRRRHGAGELPIIMVTAKDHSEDVVEAFRLGANDYVTKPIDFPVALARIATQVSHRRTQAALRDSETRYALAVRGTNDGLWDWDLRTDEVFYSARWKAMLGYEDGELGTRPDDWLRRVHPDDDHRLRSELAAHRRGTTAQFECEHRLLHKDQTYRWVLARGAAIHDCGGRSLRMAGSLIDITEGKISDPLTGLPNRILLMDRIELALERSRRQPDSRFAVLFLDLDRFKLINDSLGHIVGDQLLIAFSRRLEGCVGETDIVSRAAVEHTITRLGGDEFTILLEGIDGPDDAIRVAERIHRVLSVPFSLGGQEVFTTTSIGIAMGGPACRRPEDLLREADTAMYDAKGRGKARHEVFDSAMHARAVARLQSETEMRRALENGEFRLHYQPIVTMGTGRPIGFEALLRWQHPRHGLIAPDDFIPMAEETGLIVPIGWWVLEEACRQMGAWHARFPDAATSIICVNLSSKQFLQAGLVEQVERRLRDAGLHPRALKLEITESAIMSDPKSAADALERLRSLGVRIAIDDFGTGHSSLSYLQQFPIDTLKIDRSFVRKMHDQVKDREIIQAVVSLAHNLGMDVVAEGVETSDQWDQLDILGCEYGQGFFFSRPVDGPVAEALLAGETHPGSSGIGDRGSGLGSKGIR